jgi:Xaa-Pro aminopeptidase
VNFDMRPGSGVNLTAEALRPIDYCDRLTRVQTVMAQRADLGHPRVFLVTDPVSIRWCTGFSGSSAWLVIADSFAAFGTDGRYLERAQAGFAEAGLNAFLEVFGALTRTEMDAQMYSVMKARTGAHPGSGSDSARDFGAVGCCAAQVTHQRWGEIAKEICLVDEVDPVLDLRRHKDAAEIQRIERAAAIADAALADTLGLLRSEVLPTEMDFRTEIEYQMRRLGADGPSYDTIVACGPDHAARPHHEASGRQMMAGETLVIDVGALVDGYHSDMTRSYVLGEPTAEQQDLYDLLARVQAAGLAAAQPGALTRDVDAACRNMVAAHGLADWYLHSTGHGVGLVIHENPFSAPSSHQILEVGDVVTVEPGLYRAGFGGLRIEDLVLITDNGHRILTHTAKDSPCLPSPPTI